MHYWCLHSRHLLYCTTLEQGSYGAKTTFLSRFDFREGTNVIYVVVLEFGDMRMMP